MQNMKGFKKLTQSPQDSRGMRALNRVQSVLIQKKRSWIRLNLELFSVLIPKCLISEIKDLLYSWKEQNYHKLHDIPYMRLLESSYNRIKSKLYLSQKSLLLSCNFSFISHCEFIGNFSKW
jgi:hypothetical protein